MWLSVADKLLDVLGRTDSYADDARAGGVVASRTDDDAFGGIDDVDLALQGAELSRIDVAASRSQQYVDLLHGEVCVVEPFLEPLGCSDELFGLSGEVDVVGDAVGVDVLDEGGLWRLLLLNLL